MTVISQALSRVLATVEPTEILKQLAMFCGAGLLVALMLLTYGIDLSPGFF